jgi:hypothetical protein
MVLGPFRQVQPSSNVQVCDPTASTRLFQSCPDCSAFGNGKWLWRRFKGLILPRFVQSALPPGRKVSYCGETDLYKSVVDSFAWCGIVSLANHV